MVRGEILAALGATIRVAFCIVYVVVLETTESQRLMVRRERTSHHFFWVDFGFKVGEFGGAGWGVVGGWGRGA